MKVMKAEALHSFLEEKYRQYNNSAFIDSDPVSIPHLFSEQGDIEISAFLTATISWGQRVSILKNASTLMQLMDNAPLQFVKSFERSDLGPFKKFKHRTFNGDDCIFFLNSLQHIYKTHGSLESAFRFNKKDNDCLKTGIISARNLFFSIPHQKRVSKHFADPGRGSAAKRINMFLRWMVRKDSKGVDLGIWKSLSPSVLHCPLDVHSGRVARKLGLLKRHQDDWLAVEELTASLRKFDPKDPVKYDYALFGLGVFEKF